MKTIAALPIALLLAACASTYKPNGLAGGFSETQLDTNVFRVSFHGNGYTHRDRAEELALLRSADVTLKSGFTHFIIVAESDGTRGAVMTMPTQSYTTANATAYGNTAYGTAHTTTTGGQSFNFTFPNLTNTIVCFHGKPDVQGLVYDAEFLCKSLGAKYSATCGAQ